MLFFPTRASATVFFSIETTRDELVLVDSATGNVASQGSIGVDMRDPDLAVIGSVIYVVNSLFTEGLAQVLSLDVQGHVLSLDTLNVGGVPVPHAEGLTAIDGELWSSFHLNSASPFSSDALGRLSLDGALTDIVSFVGTDSLADGDGLCRNPSAEALWLDVNPPALDDRRLIDVSRPPQSLFQQHPLQIGYLPINDIDFNADGDSLWGIAGDGQLHLIAYPTFVILDSVGYAAGNALVGLARSSVTTGVAPGAPLDLAFDISVFPNPATERLFIEVPRRPDLLVTIHDTGGRHIWSHRTDAGMHLSWDMKDVAGRPAAAGVYFVRVISGAQTAIRRVTVIR